MPRRPNPALWEVLYQYLIGFIEENGYQPSQEEMARAMNVTKNAITGRLHQLVKRKLIRLSDGSGQRCIRLLCVKFTAYAVAPEKGDSPGGE